MKHSELKNFKEPKPFKAFIKGAGHIFGTYDVENVPTNEVTSLISQMLFDPSRFYINSFCRAVLSWDITDDSGQVLPINPSTVGSLPVPIVRAIFEAIQDAEQNKPPIEGL